MLARKPTPGHALGSPCAKLCLKSQGLPLLHPLLVVVKVDPHVVNCLTVLIQDGGLRDKFNPERGRDKWVNEESSLIDISHRIKCNPEIERQLEKSEPQSWNLLPVWIQGFRVEEDSLKENLADSVRDMSGKGKVKLISTKIKPKIWLCT